MLEPRDDVVLCSFLLYLPYCSTPSVHVVHDYTVSPVFVAYRLLYHPEEQVLYHLPRLAEGRVVV